MTPLIRHFGLSPFAFFLCCSPFSFYFSQNATGDCQRFKKGIGEEKHSTALSRPSEDEIPPDIDFSDALTLNIHRIQDTVTDIRKQK